MKDDAVTTGVPISDADSPASKRLLCITVCDDGLYCGTTVTPRCIDPIRCIDEGGCFWRRWHGLPADVMTKKCDAVD